MMKKGVHVSVMGKREARYHDEKKGCTFLIAKKGRHVELVQTRFEKGGTSPG